MCITSSVKVMSYLQQNNKVFLNYCNCCFKCWTHKTPLFLETHFRNRIKYCKRSLIFFRNIIFPYQVTYSMYQVFNIFKSLYYILLFSKQNELLSNSIIFLTLQKYSCHIFNNQNTSYLAMFLSWKIILSQTLCKNGNSFCFILYTHRNMHSDTQSFYWSISSNQHINGSNLGKLFYICSWV